MILLTDEEIRKVIKNDPPIVKGTLVLHIYDEQRAIAKAQLKKVVESGSKPIFGQVDDLGQCATIIIHIPISEYDALLEEVSDTPE